MDQRGYQLFLMELSDAANRSAARVLSAAMQHCDQMGGSVCHLVREVYHVIIIIARSQNNNKSAPDLGYIIKCARRLISTYA